MSDDRVLTPEDLEALQRERDFVQPLIRLWRTIGLYGIEHPTVDEGLDFYLEHALPYLQEVQSLTILVESHSFTSDRFEGEELARDRKDDGGICNRLFLDGFRELTFEEHLPSEEVRELLRIWSANLRSNENAEETLVTMIWKSEFRRISYTAVSGFQDACDFQPASSSSWETQVSRIQSPTAAKAGPTLARGLQSGASLGGATSSQSLALGSSGPKPSRPTATGRPAGIGLRGLNSGSESSGRGGGGTGGSGSGGIGGRGPSGGDGPG
ncbi:MAG: hypothetical protein QGG40_02805, partial [Myxococcota bacterium]|nr:hypothetical protein [Myxococcota bacterium]